MMNEDVEVDIKLGPVWVTGKDDFHKIVIDRLRHLPETKKAISGGYNPATNQMTMDEDITLDLGYPPGVQKWELTVMEGLEPMGYKLRIESDGENPEEWNWEQTGEVLRPIAQYFGDYVGITDNFQVELAGFPYKIGLIELTDSSYGGPNETGHFRIIGDAIDPDADDFDRGTRQYFFKDKTLLSFRGAHLGEVTYGYGNIDPVWVSEGSNNAYQLSKGYNLEVWAPIIARQLLQLGVDGDTQIKIQG